MRSQEKAKELFDKYYIICQEFTEEIQCSIQAKQCALIAVDEMLDLRNGLYMNEGSIVHQYLMDVKQEIEKL
jgi:hypothetical protein